MWGRAGSFAINATGYPTPSITESGSLPSGVTFSAGSGVGQLSGTPAGGTAGTYHFSFTASNGVNPPAAQTFTLTVSQAPAFISAAATTFTVGSLGSFSVTASGSPAPTLSETGTLPSGVTFTAGTGLLSGTPAAGTGGVYQIFFTATNGTTPPVTQPFTLTVDQAPVITSPAAATFTVGQAGTFTITTTGVPVPSIFLSFGSLPPGVTLIDNGNGTATLSGTPAGLSGTYHVSFTASNGVGSPVTQPFTVTVDQDPAITSANATTFTVGQSGTFTVTTTGFPASALSEIGTLPAGVSFVDNGDGTASLSGTPGAGSGGTFHLTIQASNGVGPVASQTFTLTVDQAPAITSPGGDGFVLGQPGSFTVTTSGYPVPALSLTGTLPAGLSFTDLGDGTATITGTPTRITHGPVTLRVTATNAVGSVSVPFLVTVTTGSMWLTTASGGVFNLGASPFYGSMQAQTLNKAIVGLAATPDGGGYWLVASDGGIFSFGDAAFYGSTGSMTLNQPIVGLAATPDGGGYWLVASDGGIFSYGDAAFYGSTGSMTLNKPIVGLAVTPDGGGYWLVASDGGIFAFGDAAFYGSTGSMTLNEPIVGMAANPDGGGYWLVASDGGHLQLRRRRVLRLRWGIPPPIAPGRHGLERRRGWLFARDPGRRCAHLRRRVAPGSIGGYLVGSPVAGVARP